MVILLFPFSTPFFTHTGAETATYWESLWNCNKQSRWYDWCTKVHVGDYLDEGEEPIHAVHPRYCTPLGIWKPAGSRYQVPYLKKYQQHMSTQLTSTTTTHQSTGTHRRKYRTFSSVLRWKSNKPFTQSGCYLKELSKPFWSISTHLYRLLTAIEILIWLQTAYLPSALPSRFWWILTFLLMSSLFFHVSARGFMQKQCINFRAIFDGTEITVAALDAPGPRLQQFLSEVPSESSKCFYFKKQRASDSIVQHQVLSTSKEHLTDKHWEFALSLSRRQPT